MRLALVLAAALSLSGSLLAGAFAVAETPPVTAPATPAASDADPYIWLEEMQGPKALEWVERENARSLAILKGDPRFEPFHQDALKIVNATDRIAMPSLIGQGVYNFWQDPTNVRGLWRRTTRASYAGAEPKWETVLDIDALSTAEKANWVWGGATCPPPKFERCLISLSDGGEDADDLREFDLKTRAFVKDGFHLPRSKQAASWVDDDTLMVTRDWGAGTMTESGYGFVVKTLKRGQPLDQATEVFRGKVTDVGAFPVVLHDAAGARAMIISRAVSFFETEYYLITPKGPVRLPLPLKSTVQALVNGQLIATLEEAYTPAGASQPLPQGAVVALELKAAEAGLPPKFALLVAPGPRQSIEQVAVTRTGLVVALYDNVRGGLAAFTYRGGAWKRSAIPVAANASVHVVTASDVDETIYYSVEGYLEPTRLWQTTIGAAGPGRAVKALPARFDASRDEVEQFEAASSDGVKIPYFVVHPKGMKLDGSNPTLLYAYGGFQSSETPGYSPTVGKLWLEHGGVYVVANIRGGGEFGPAWHDAGLKTKRQIIYDDFAAVAKDLIGRGITSPRRLGIEGGSNGGLLMGVEFNQHPDLWRAVVIQVPLLDMLRFEKIGAGASWVGEYGSVSVPEEAAFLRTISPYHNLRPGVAYPEPFFVTSTKDDRVTPVHARKMAARMQEMGLPFLYFENTNGGHAASANLQERAERVSLEFTYLTRKLVD